MECPKCGHALGIEEGVGFKSLACTYCGFRKYNFGSIKERLEKEEEMMYSSKEKTCDCGKIYKPTSNAQKRCPECKPQINKERYAKKPQVSHPRPVIKKAIREKNAEPEARPEAGAISMKISIDRKAAAYLAQLVYASELLDQQINLAVEEGVIDTKSILDIRYRLGAVLRGTVET